MYQCLSFLPDYGFETVTVTVCCGVKVVGTSVRTEVLVSPLAESLPIALPMASPAKKRMAAARMRASHESQGRRDFARRTRALSRSRSRAVEGSSLDISGTVIARALRIEREGRVLHEHGVLDPGP
jgi:hypothetical protein